MRSLSYGDVKHQFDDSKNIMMESFFRHYGYGMESYHSPSNSSLMMAEQEDIKCLKDGTRKGNLKIMFIGNHPEPVDFHVQVNH